jgi:transcription elongation GreA/GreB family factor
MLQFITALKTQIVSVCNSILIEKQLVINSALNQINEASANETKSTAGDKYETAKAMLQLEQEKLNKQLTLLKQQQQDLLKINLEKTHSLISQGSLIKTTQGFIFIGVSLGKITVNDSAVIAISAQSPLALKLIGLSINTTVDFNNQLYIIESLC